jgi:hypothetical protein
VDGIDIRIRQNLVEVGVAALDPEGFSYLIETTECPVADRDEIGKWMVLVDRDEVGTEPESDDRDAYSRAGHPSPPSSVVVIAPVVH